MKIPPAVLDALKRANTDDHVMRARALFEVQFALTQIDAEPKLEPKGLRVVRDESLPFVPTEGLPF